MSWIERIQTEYTITTGDGETYSPQMINASKNIEYNVARFEFKELSGSLVKRGTPRGTQYAIEIYFQGEDHLEVSDAFEASAADPRPWTIRHPFYGQLLVQPISLTFDNALLNVTRITGGIVETISETPDRVVTSPAEKVLADKGTTDAAFATAAVTAIPEPSALDMHGMIANAAGTYNAALASIINAADLQSFREAYNAANAAITSVTSSTLNTFQVLQAYYSLPMTFAASVVNRLSMLGNMLAYLTGQIRGDMSRGARMIFELSAGTLITSMAGAVMQNTAGAFGTRRQTLGVMQSLLGGYNDYLSWLDSLQALNGGMLGGYIPSREPLQLLSNLINYAAGVLLDTAAASRQERTVVLGSDTNVIILASQLVGLMPDDSTIDELIAINELGISDLLVLKHGRNITYYV